MDTKFRSVQICFWRLRAIKKKEKRKKTAVPPTLLDITSKSSMRLHKILIVDVLRWRKKLFGKLENKILSEINIKSHSQSAVCAATGGQW